MKSLEPDKSYSRLDEAVNKIAVEIKRLEQDKAKLSEALREAKATIDLNIISNQITSDLLEKRISNEVRPTDLFGLRVAGIDGGVVARQYENVDLILTRAVAAIFTYGFSGRLEVTYFPEEMPLPSIISNLQPSPTPDFDVRASIERLTCELKLAVDLQEYTKVDLIILDGSIVPQQRDRPPSYSMLNAKYQRLIGLYEKLYESCIDSGTLLAGAVKDSRSIRFTQIMGRLLPHLIQKVPRLEKLLESDYRNAVQHTRDSELLQKVLDPGERTPIFSYVETPQDNAVFADFTNRKWLDLVNVFYLRTVQYDVPIRIEFLGTEVNRIQTAKRIASVMLPLSYHHAEYGFPSVLVEADARAHLFDQDIEIIHEQLAQKTGDSMTLTKLRRDRRPFR